jgi:DNA polymerase-3 subunit epsilon
MAAPTAAEEPVAVPNGPSHRAASPEAAPRERYVQATFDSLGEPLHDVTFVVLDLETTGGSAEVDSITEIGAVKVRGGEVLGEFQTLINPGTGIPPFIVVLTGITDAMVAPAPMIQEVLPGFLEFARGAVLVAHNAPFDLGFLKAACARHEMEWPTHRKLDTAVLARRVLTRDEAPNCKLATLARLFRTETEPCHRALADARATVDVLHGLIGRVGNLGVQTLDELETFTHQVSEAQRRKRYLAEGLPSGPGVYIFRDGNDRALYVGTSKDVRTRVRNYFVSSENRTRMAEMVSIAERVDAIACAHSLEAEVRELRLIAAHKPPYNRRSKYPERTVWLKLTVEAYPRLSVVRSVRDDGAVYLGPFGSRRSAEAAINAVHDAVPLRQCTTTLSTRTTSPACALAEIGRCGAPCQHAESPEEYGRHVETFTRAVNSDPTAMIEPLLARIDVLALAQRYEEAGLARDRLAALLRVVLRMQRLRAFTNVPELVAAHPDGDGGWELTVVRHGRLVAAGVAPRGVPPMPQVDMLVTTAETVLPGLGPTPCASAEETERVLTWLERPATRMVRIAGEWVSPASGAGKWRDMLDRIEAGRAGADPFADRRHLRPVHQPPRVTA